MEFRTERLTVSAWTKAERGPFWAMSSDAEVMAHLSKLAIPADADAWIDRQIAHRAEHGFCFWAIHRRACGTFLGAVGLIRVGYQAHFVPAVEIGWRLARAAWGQGYAVEAAGAALQFGFQRLGLTEIVANAAVANLRSRRVMARLGMSHDAADDFDHPRLPEGDPLRRQVLYRIDRATWDHGGACPIQP